MARSGGFEPSTYRFVAGHSIHCATSASYFVRALSFGCYDIVAHLFSNVNSFLNIF